MRGSSLSESVEEWTVNLKSELLPQLQTRVWMRALFWAPGPGGLAITLQTRTLVGHQALFLLWMFPEVIVLFPPQ